MNKKILVFLSVFFLIGFCSATFHYTDYDQKWILCNAMNLTGSACDSYWESASDFGNLNQTTNITCIFNESKFYSKEQVDYLFANLTSVLNISNGTISKSDNYITEIYFNETIYPQLESKFFAYVDSSLGSINGEEKEGGEDGDSEDNNYLLIFAFFVIVGLVVVVIILMMKNQKPQFIEQTQKSAYPQEYHPPWVDNKKFENPDEISFEEDKAAIRKPKLKNKK